MHMPMSDIHTRISASFNSQGLMATLGARLVLVTDGEVHIELPFSAGLSQQNGYVHAGAVTSVVDSACGYAALTKAPAEFDVVTAEFKINFMRPALGERFLAVGERPALTGPVNRTGPAAAARYACDSKPGAWGISEGL